MEIDFPVDNSKLELLLSWLKIVAESKDQKQRETTLKNQSRTLSSIAKEDIN